MEETIDAQDSGNITITPKMAADLKAAGPWMKFVSIFYIVICGLSLLVPLLLITQTFHISLIIMMAMYGLGIYLGTLILKMGNNYSSFVSVPSTLLLEKAFDAQKKFWMITGILLIFFILFLIIGYGYISTLQESNPNMFK